MAERCNGGHFLAADSASSSYSSSGEPAKGPAPPARPWRLWLVALALLLALGAGLGLPLALGGPGRRDTPQARLDTVRRLLRDSPLVDGHNDLAWNVRKFMHNKIGGLNLSADLARVEPWAKSQWSHTDIPRLRAGLVGAQFWSAYVPCGAQHADAVQLTLEQIDVIKRLIDLNPRHLSLVTGSRELLDTHRAGRIASLIGVEGGHSLGNSLGVLRSLYGLGARYLTVTHTCDTPWAGAAGGDKGLTPFGRTVIREMNRLGMLVDLSHVAATTARDALNASHAPVVFSHSGAMALCNSTRNVPDDILKLVARNGGVVMVNFFSQLVTCNDTATIKDVIRHINHIRAVAGVDHVGIGAGYDGINMTPTGLEDVSRYPHLLAELLADPAWSERDVLKLAGLNVVRALGRVEEVRDKWRLAAVLPAEEPPPAPAEPSSCSYPLS